MDGKVVGSERLEKPLFTSTKPPRYTKRQHKRSFFKLGRWVLTFMSFMMTWKSPPKALHSFSIPASIFPQARKNAQLPNA